MGALVAFGALLKVWPALLLIGVARGAVRRVWVSAAVTGAVVLAAFAVAMPNALGFLTAQRDRGTEVESLGALVFHVARYFGWQGEVQLHYGSLEFLGPGVAGVSLAAQLLSVVALGWLVYWRLRARVFVAGTTADAAFTAVLLFTTTSRVISPQYLLWLVALAAVCLLFADSGMTRPAVLVVAASAVTVLEFPVFFGDVVGSTPLGVGLMLVRNGLLVAACLLAGRALWRRTVPGAAGATPEGLSPAPPGGTPARQP